MPGLVCEHQPQDKQLEKLHQLERTWDPFWKPPWVLADYKPRPWEFYNKNPVELYKWQQRPQNPEANLRALKRFGEGLQKREVRQRFQAERERVQLLRQDEQQFRAHNKRNHLLDQLLLAGQHLLARNQVLVGLGEVQEEEI